LTWTDFHPAPGREQGGRRPALVVSDALFTVATGLAAVCPIMSRVRPLPTSVVLPEGVAVSGEILLSRIRSIDTLARPVRFAGGSVTAAVAALVRAKLWAIVAISGGSSACVCT